MSVHFARELSASLLRWSLFWALLLAFILVPFFLLEDNVNAFAQRLLHTDHSLLLMFVIVAGLLVADIFLPIPSSFVMTMAGFAEGFVAGALASFVGLVCSCAVGYWLGQHGGSAIAARILGRAQLERFTMNSARYGDAMLIVFRAAPVLAEASVILAGMARMPLQRFFALTSLGNLGIALAYAWIGAYSADRAAFLLAFGASILLPVGVVVALRLCARARRLRD